MRGMVLVAGFCVLCGPLVADDGVLVEGSRIRLRAATPVATEDGIIVGTPGHWLTGRLIAIAPEYLTIAPDGMSTNVLVASPAVRTLQVSRGRSRGKGALIGAGVGTLLGLAWGVIEERRCEAAGQWFCELAYFLPVLTTPAGTLVGVAVGKESWTDKPPSTFRVGVVPTRGGVQVAGRITF